MANDFSKIAIQLQKHKTVQGIMKYVNQEALIEQHKKQEKNKATGIDNVSKIDYEENLKENTAELINRMKSMSYKPQDVKRVYIPKTGSNELRPLGIPAYEDRLVQGAMADVLNEIYEHIFLDCSFGFRPGRDCHQAIKKLDEIIMKKNINYVVDADIKGFFNNVNHEWLVKFLELTIQDPKFIQYIVRFLKSGIMENMQHYESDKGTPQGGLISPILANVYLHYVLDLWFELYIRIKCKGGAYLIRYADDFVCCFEKEEDAEMFYAELKDRLKKFDLELAEDKSRIIPFGNNDSKEKFDFLGFTHVNGVNRKGNYKLVHHTSGKKSKAKKQAVKLWLMESVRIYKIPYLIKKLNIKLQGTFRYYGVSDNYDWMIKFRKYVIYQLHEQLCRRSQKGKISWKKFYKIIEYNPIVMPKIYHSMWQ
ncbi:MAG: group II intron reverse transcriptase/maturase [Clostridia bacterium]|nr:group II intron reverse transcriptase/maturase [Clostridia bacterium]